MSWPKDEDFEYPVELEFKPNPILGGIKDWQPSDEREAFFGTDRGTRLPDGRWLVADINVSDIAGLAWRERLFSWPWRPWVKHKSEPKAYVVGDSVLVSYESYHRFKSGEYKLP